MGAATMRHRRVPIARRTPIRRSLKAKGSRTPKRRKKRLSLSKQADALWAQVVKVSGQCYSCGKTERLQAAHGFSRRYRGTRWLPINGFPLCSFEHMYWTHRPLEWDEWLRKVWGEPVYENLRALALKTAKPDFPGIIASLKAELEKWDTWQQNV